MNIVSDKIIPGLYRLMPRHKWSNMIAGLTSHFPGNNRGKIIYQTLDRIVDGITIGKINVLAE